MCVLFRSEVVNYAKNYCCGHSLREIPFLIHRLCVDAFRVISQLSGVKSRCDGKGSNIRGPIFAERIAKHF